MINLNYFFSIFSDIFSKPFTLNLFQILGPNLVATVILVENTKFYNTLIKPIIETENHVTQENIVLKYENSELKQELKTSKRIIENQNKYYIIRPERVNYQIAKHGLNGYVSKREPITFKIYDLLIKAVPDSNYKSARLKVALLILLITGVRVSKLLPLKVHQIKPLFESYSIQVKTNLSKEKFRIDQAFLSNEGKKLVDERNEDFKTILKTKSQNSYLFTPQSNNNKMLSRETITKEVNNLMRFVAKNLPGQPNITSHSFRTGFYILYLWKKFKDVRLVQQAISDELSEELSTIVNKDFLIG